MTAARPAPAPNEANATTPPAPPTGASTGSSPAGMAGMAGTEIAWRSFVSAFAAAEQQPDPLSVDDDPTRTTFVYQGEQSLIAFVGCDTHREEVIVFACLDQLEPGRSMTHALLRENAMVREPEDHVLGYLPAASGVTGSARLKLASLSPNNFGQTLDRLLLNLGEIQSRLAMQEEAFDDDEPNTPNTEDNRTRRGATMLH